MQKVVIFILFSLGGFLVSCQPDSSELILGSWQVDSVYAYYNGFDYWDYQQGADWATYEYTADGYMKEIKFGTYRPYRYRISRDTLHWIAEQEPHSGTFQILELHQGYMVLRKEKAPIFEGKRQDRYEIRFFSRVEPTGRADAYLHGQK